MAITDKKRATNTAWWAANPDYLSSRRNYFIRHLGMAGRRQQSTVTYDDLIALWDLQRGHCAISGVPMTHQSGDGVVATNMSIDRIDRTLGYVPGNIRLVCDIANKMRHTMTDAELLEWCKMIVSHV